MKDLVKNPIGIVALFISLIYGFANLLLGVTATALTADERHPIIIFIVLFPVIVLGVFYMLVSRHHGKLYAPGDYKDDKSFLRTLSQEEREAKLEKEINEALPEPESTVLNSPQAAPESVTPTQEKHNEYRREIQIVESLVISQYERDLNSPARRDIGIGDTGVLFDAIFADTKPVTCLEIKSMRYPTLGSQMLDRLLYNAVVADKYLNSNFKLIIVVVYSFGKNEANKIENMWRKRIEKCPATVEVKFIQRDEVGA